MEDIVNRQMNELSALMQSFRRKVERKKQIKTIEQVEALNDM
jgi:hypothetical protein